MRGNGNLLGEEMQRCEPERLKALSESHPTRQAGSNIVIESS